MQAQWHVSEETVRKEIRWPTLLFIKLLRTLEWCRLFAERKGQRSAASVTRRNSARC